MSKGAHQNRSGIAAWCALLLFPLRFRILLWGIPLLLPSPLLGQFSVYPVQDLAFGQIPAGTPSAIAPTDAARRAEVDVGGTGLYTLNVILPTEMVTMSGARFPISFDSSDGILRYRRLGWQLSFDPTTPTSVWIPWWESGASVYLGGTAEPAASQPPGQYRATITVQIINSGT